jgi:hypothetical protein
MYAPVPGIPFALLTQDPPLGGCDDGGFELGGLLDDDELDGGWLDDEGGLLDDDGAWLVVDEDDGLLDELDGAGRLDDEDDVCVFVGDGGSLDDGLLDEDDGCDGAEAEVLGCLEGDPPC